MAPLIEPITYSSQPEDPRVVEREVRAAHNYIVECAERTVNRHATSAFGIESKRAKVDLTGERPELVGATEHPMAEVVNQCATVERLLDALRWIAAREGDWRITVVNPTTSSAKTSRGVEAADDTLSPDDHSPDDKKDGNDIVAINNGTTALFEVSDVAGPGDGNRKLQKDLMSLGLLEVRTPDDEHHGVEKQEIAAREDVDWDSTERYLVVSDEWTTWLTKQRSASGQLKILRTAGVNLSPCSGFAQTNDSRPTGVLRVLPNDIQKP